MKSNKELRKEVSFHPHNEHMGVDALDERYQRAQEVLGRLRKEQLTNSQSKNDFSMKSKRRPEQYERPWKTLDIQVGQKRTQERSYESIIALFPNRLPSKCGINEDNFCACGQNESEVVRRLPQDPRITYCADGSCSRAEDGSGRKCQHNNAEVQKDIEDVLTLEVQVNQTFSASTQYDPPVPYTREEALPLDTQEPENRNTIRIHQETATEIVEEYEEEIKLTPPPAPPKPTPPPAPPKPTPPPGPSAPPAPPTKTHQRCCCCFKKYVAAAVVENSTFKCCKCQGRSSQGDGQRKSCEGHNERRCCNRQTEDAREQRYMKGCQCSDKIKKTTGGERSCCGQKASKNKARPSVVPLNSDCQCPCPPEPKKEPTRRPKRLQEKSKSHKEKQSKSNQPNNSKPRNKNHPNTDKYRLIASTTNPPCTYVGDSHGAENCPGVNTQNIHISCNEEGCCAPCECSDNPDPCKERCPDNSKCCPLVVVNNTDLCECEEKWTRVDEWRKAMQKRDKCHKKLLAQREQEEQARRHLERQEADDRHQKYKEQLRHLEKVKMKEERRWRRKQLEAEMDRMEREEARWAEDMLDREEDRQIWGDQEKRVLERNWRKEQLALWPSEDMKCPELEELRRALVPVPLDGMNETFEFFCSEPQPHYPSEGGGGGTPQILQIQEGDKGVNMRFPQCNNMPKTCVCVRMPPANCHEGKVINVFAGGRRPGGGGMGPGAGGSNEIPPQVFNALSKVKQIANPSPNSWLGSVGASPGVPMNPGTGGIVLMNNSNVQGRAINNGMHPGFGYQHFMSGQPANTFMPC